MLTSQLGSLNEVTAVNSVDYTTMTPDGAPVTTMSLYAISYPATIKCEYDDGMIGAVRTSTGTDNIATITCDFGGAYWRETDGLALSQSCGCIAPAISLAAFDIVFESMLTCGLLPWQTTNR